MPVERHWLRATPCPAHDVQQLADQAEGVDLVVVASGWKAHQLGAASAVFAARRVSANLQAAGAAMGVDRTTIAGPSRLCSPHRYRGC
jgi:hypothetical protein